jgi:hypothetical protein
MAQQRTRIHYPIKGISEHFGYSVQEEMTCRDDRNVRSRDPRTGRIRGAQRAGMGLYAGAAQLNGNNRVKALAATSTAQAKLAFSEDLAGTEDWDNANKSFGDIADMTRGPYESYVTLTGNNKVVVFNEDGQPIHEITLPEVDPGVNDRPFGSCVAMDEFQNIFVGTTHAGNGVGTDCALYIYRYNEDDTYLHVYTLSFDESVLDIKAVKNRLYVLTAEDPAAQTAQPATVGTDATKVYFRLRVFEDYLPFNEAPVENDDLRYSYGFQTAPSAVQQGGNDYFFFANEQNVGRLSVTEDGIVLASIASIDGINQEWGGLLWLHPNATEGTTDLVDSKFVCTLGMYETAEATLSGIGLEGQWLGDAVDNEDTVLCCGDPFSFQELTVTSTAPLSSSFLDLVGRAQDTGFFGATLRLVWTGTGATPNFIGQSGSIYSYGIASTPGATVEERVDQLVAAMNFAQTHTEAGKFAAFTLTKKDASTVLIGCPRPTVDTNADVPADIDTYYIYAGLIGNTWATPFNANTTFSAGVNVRRVVAERTTALSSIITAGGNTFTQSLEGRWGTATPQSLLIRFGQDQNNNAYIPWGRASASASFDSKAVAFFPGEYSASDQRQFTCSGYSNFVSAAAPPLDVPDYYDDATLLHAPFVIIGGPRDTASAGDPSLWRFNIVSAVNTTGAPRALHVIGVADNKIVKILSDSVVEPDNNAVIDSSAPYVQIASGFQKCYIADGLNYWVYDPLDTEVSANGSVKKLRCDSVGNIPQRCRLVELWHGRLVLARDPADPGRWSMSAINDPNNWDYFPTIPSALQACSSTNTRAGRVPDIINTVVVYSDDLLLFGGDRTIYQLTGDPMAGGSLDLVTDETGMAFGRPYCKDPQGTLWFFGSTGGLFYMVPGQRPQRASVNRVEKSLRSIDLGANYVQLQWNPIDEGVHIFVIPFGAPSGTLVDHWFYEVSTDAWHKDRFGLANNDNIQPCASVRMDGDLYNDRTLLIGGEDGRVRRWGIDASGNIPRHDEQTDSANIGIDSYALFGPLIQAPIAAAQLTEASFVLASDQHGVNYEFFAESTPDDLGEPVRRGRLRPGRNDRHLVRIAGDHVYMRMRNASVGESWAYESGDAEIAQAGSTRR